MNVKMLIVVLIFIAMDIAVGLVKAFASIGFKSVKMREGLIHKVGEIICVGFGVLCEYSFPYVGIEVNIPIVSTICVYIVLMETGSIVENHLAEISPSIKRLLGKVFDGYRQEES